MGHICSWVSLKKLSWKDKILSWKDQSISFHGFITVTQQPYVLLKVSEPPKMWLGSSHSDVFLGRILAPGSVRWRQTHHHGGEEKVEVLGEDAGSLNSLWTVSRKIILFMSIQLDGWVIKLDEVKGSKVWKSEGTIYFILFFFYFLFFKFYFIFKLYIIVLVLPNIKMNPPQVYMCIPVKVQFKIPPC